MNRTPYYTNWKGLLNISLGLFVVVLYSFLLFHTFQFVSADKEFYWWSAIISYTVMFSLVLTIPKARDCLFKIRLSKYSVRFLMFYIPAIFALSWILQLFPIGEVGILGALHDVPKWLLFIHAFVFTLIESCFWQGWLDYPYPIGIGHPWSEIVAGLFHWGIWLGGALVVIPSAGILFMFFSAINWYFRDSINDIGPAHAVHTAYNHIKLFLGF